MNKMSLITIESREAFGVRRVPALLTISRLATKSSESGGMRRTPSASRLARNFQFWMTSVIFAIGTASGAEQEIEIKRTIEPGNTKPILVSMSGFSGEAAQVLQFDLFVQGFAFTNADSAQYLISGSNNGNLQGRAADRFSKNTLVSKAYSGVSLRRQAHTFADDFVNA